jgi:hypothetical protein
MAARRVADDDSTKVGAHIRQAPGITTSISSNRPTATGGHALGRQWRIQPSTATAMIVRIDIDQTAPSVFAYRVSVEAETLYDDESLGSFEEALIAAIEGLAPDAVAIELAYGGVVSGTYPLHVIATNLDQVATHAINTTAAIYEARAR